MNVKLTATQTTVIKAAAALRTGRHRIKAKSRASTDATGRKKPNR